MGLRTWLAESLGIGADSHWLLQVLVGLTDKAFEREPDMLPLTISPEQGELEEKIRQAQARMDAQFAGPQPEAVPSEGEPATSEDGYTWKELAERFKQIGKGIEHDRLQTDRVKGEWRWRPVVFVPYRQETADRLVILAEIAGRKAAAEDGDDAGEWPDRYWLTRVGIKTEETKEHRAWARLVEGSINECLARRGKLSGALARSQAVVHSPGSLQAGRDIIIGETRERGNDHVEATLRRLRRLIRRGANAMSGLQLMEIRADLQTVLEELVDETADAPNHSEIEKAAARLGRLQPLAKIADLEELKALLSLMRKEKNACTWQQLLNEFRSLEPDIHSADLQGTREDGVWSWGPFSVLPHNREVTRRLNTMAAIAGRKAAAEDGEEMEGKSAEIYWYTRVSSEDQPRHFTKPDGGYIYHAWWTDLLSASITECLRRLDPE